MNTHLYKSLTLTKFESTNKNIIISLFIFKDSKNKIFLNKLINNI